MSLVALTTTITNFSGVYCPAYMIMHAEDHLISLLSISAVVARLNLVVCFLIFSVNIAFSPFLYRPFEWTLFAGGKWPTRGAKSATWEANLRSSEKGFTRTALHLPHVNISNGMDENHRVGPLSTPVHRPKGSRKSFVIIVRIIFPPGCEFILGPVLWQLCELR